MIYDDKPNIEQILSQARSSLMRRRLLLDRRTRTRTMRESITVGVFVARDE